MVFCCVSSSFSAVLWLKQFITAVQLHPLASLCGICSGESGTGMGFSLKTSVSFVSIIPPCGTFIHLFIHLLLMVCNLRKWQHHQITYSHNNSPPLVDDAHHIWSFSYIVCSHIWLHCSLLHETGKSLCICRFHCWPPQENINDSAGKRQLMWITPYCWDVKGTCAEQELSWSKVPAAHYTSLDCLLQCPHWHHLVSYNI